MTFGSLFSGIGGMDLGLERAGIKCRWQVEIDPYCNRVLEKHWPNVKRYGDIRQIAGSELERVDCIAGGFPCQDISAANAVNSIGRRGLGGERSGLWREYHRIVCALRPRYVLIENVAALLAADDSGIIPISIVLGSLAEIGYDAEWEVLRACEDGTPHPRARVFIVAHPHGERLEASIFKATECHEANQLWDSRHGESSRRKDVLCRERIGAALASEPSIVGVAHAIPGRVDRIKALGNAVVPQVAEWIGRRILASYSPIYQPEEKNLESRKEGL